MKKTLSLIISFLMLLSLFGCSSNKQNNDSVVTFPTDYNSSSQESTTETIPVLEATSVNQNIISDGILPDQLKQQADAISERYGAVAVQIAVMKNNQLMYTYEYGYADTDNEVLVTDETKFRVASLSKFVTDMIFMNLRDRGKVNIDEDISTYLGFEVRNPYYPDDVITPAMLMSHTSSIIDSERFNVSRVNYSSETIEDLLSDETSFSYEAPGTAYSYSNFSVAIIGAICEKVTGLSFEKIAQICLFDPLDIDVSYLASNISNPGLIANLYGEGGMDVATQLEIEFDPTIGETHHIVQGNITSSAKDFLKIISVICSDGVVDTGKRILMPNSIDDILSSRIYVNGLGSGFGVEENNKIFTDKTLYAHTGKYSGMYSTFAFDPDTGNGIVILTSGATAEYVDEVEIYDITYDFINVLYPLD